MAADFITSLLEELSSKRSIASGLRGLGKRRGSNAHLSQNF